MPANAIDAARRSLDGLALGDALGKALAFCTHHGSQRVFPPGPLPFAEAWAAEPERGYGAVAYWMLARFHQGEDPKATAAQVFQGQGSKGNGGAMRSAPLGAYFAREDPALLVEQARRSAAVTHRHPEGQAGAIAVALAAAALARGEPSSSVLDRALEHTPEGATHQGIKKAHDLGLVSIEDAGAALGLGEEILAEDTAPFALWVVAHHGADLRTALEAPMSALQASFESDRDTILAIVGGIVGARGDPLPRDWWARCEHP